MWSDKIKELDGCIVNEASGTDWYMHKQTKEIKKGGAGRKILKLLPKESQYMIISEIKSDKESEFSIIVKHEDKYYFITESRTMEKS